MNELKHLGIIPDGNRRFSQKNNQPVEWGHEQGFLKLKEILNHIEKDYPEIREITVYALSSDNFHKRNKEEKNNLWDLFCDGLKDFVDNDYDFNVRFYGETFFYPANFLSLIRQVKHYKHKRMLNFLLVYAGSDYSKKEIDMVIRTGDRCSLSGFPLSKYTEVRFKKELWGDYSIKNFDEDIEWFNQQRRLMGE